MDENETEVNYTTDEAQYVDDVVAIEAWSI